MRTAGYERMARKPRGHISKDWDPRTGKVNLPMPLGIPASINRRTGKPHEHKRAISRRLARAA